MGTTFYPSDANIKRVLELDVSVFNRIVVLELLGIREDQSVGDIPADQISKLLDKVNEISLDEWPSLAEWPLAFHIREEQAVYYKSKLETILAYCLGKGCGLTWA